MKRNLQKTGKNFISVPKTPAKNNRTQMQRPKKCHNCQKMIAPQKYVNIVQIRTNI